MNAPNDQTNDPVKADDTRMLNSFNLVVTAASSFGMAAMGAFLCSVKQVNPKIVTQFDGLSVLGFIVPGVVTWLFCKKLLPSTDEALVRPWAFLSATQAPRSIRLFWEPSWQSSSCRSSASPPGRCSALWKRTAIP
jgi:hypothetical protein